MYDHPPLDPILRLKPTLDGSQMEVAIDQLYM